MAKICSVKFFRGLDLFQRLLEGNGQRISLLPGRAACRPGPQHPAGRAARQERRDGLSLQLFPCRRVAEKAGHPDQKFLEEQFHLLGILLQIADIGGDPVDLVNAHAPLDPAVHGVLLVQREVLAGLGPQQDEDFLQGALVLLLQRALCLGDDEGVPEIVDDLSGQLLRRGHQVGQPGLDGAPGHAVELGRGRLLHQRHSRLFLDGPQPHRAVRAHAGEDDADAALLPVLGQGAEEEIDRETQAAGRRRLEQVQHTVQNGHVLVGGDHIDAVRLDLHPVPDLENLHPGGALEQFGHDPLVGRVQVLDDDKGHAAAFAAPAAGTVPAPPVRRRRRRCRQCRRLLHWLCVFQPYPEQPEIMIVSFYPACRNELVFSQQAYVCLLILHSFASPPLSSLSTAEKFKTGIRNSS